MKTHVNGFGAVELDSVIGNANSAGVVAENDGGGLGIAEGNSNSAKPRTGVSERVEAGVFTFGDGGDNIVEAGAMDVDGAVDMSGRGGITKVGSSYYGTTTTYCCKQPNLIKSVQEPT